MLKIRILDQVVANQIAAGEVVERPASVIKELVENSLDAGSTVIEVDIIQGGIEYLRVTDNGMGMASEDALLAIERHATSKITLAEDLNRIHTLGFRGEALPSIASVSKFKIITRTAIEDLATQIVVTGGKVQEPEKTGANLGTTVFVEDLFYNLPARRKFLKTVNTEARYINETITKLALSRPDVKFTLKNNQRLVLKTSGTGELTDCIQAIYGREVADHLLAVDLQAAGITVKGFVSRPSFTKSSRVLQLTFVNKRSIISKLVYRAIDAAYQSKIARGTHPFALLDIEIDTEKVDINVHPQKQEVKFSDDSFVYRHVYRAILMALEYPLETTSETEQIATTAGDSENVFNKPATTFEVEGNNNISGNNSTNANLLKEAANSYPKYQQTGSIWLSDDSVVEATIKDKVQGLHCQQSEVSEQGLIPPLKNDLEPKMVTALPTRAEELVRDFDPLTGEVLQATPEITSEQLFASVNQNRLQAIGQVLNKYILAEQSSKLIIIDQHAAHERIIYDQLVVREQNNYIQELLVPEFVKLLRIEAQLVQENQSYFEKIGLRLEFIGEETVRVASVPAQIGQEDFKEFFNYLLETLLEYTKPKLADFFQAAAHSIACKAAIKAGQKLDLSQMQVLLDDLLVSTHPFTCPHGRPILIEFSEGALNKMFKRT